MSLFRKHPYRVMIAIGAVVLIMVAAVHILTPIRRTRPVSWHGVWAIRAAHMRQLNALDRLARQPIR